MSKIKSIILWVRKNAALVGSIISAVTGAVGVILTTLNRADLANDVQTVLASISGILMLIPAYHVSSVASMKAKLKLVTLTTTAIDAHPVQIVIK